MITLEMYMVKKNNAKTRKINALENNETTKKNDCYGVNKAIADRWDLVAAPIIHHAGLVSFGPRCYGEGVRVKLV